MYPIEQRLASKNGWFTPAEARAYYGRYDRHGITWHWWGDGTGASNHDNIVNYMLAGAERGEKSVNHVLSDNKITLVVGPDNVAWTSQSGNPVSVSVECQPTLGGEGYKKAGWLASEIAGRYGGDRAYYGHNYWYSTACPGTISLDRIRQEEDKWQRGEYNAAPTPTPTPTPTPPPSPTWNFVAKVGKAQVTGTGGDGLYVLREPRLAASAVTVVNEGTMMDFVGYVTNGVMGVFSGVGGWFGGVFQDAWNKVTGIFSGLWSWFRDNVWNRIVSVFSSIGTTVSDGISGAFRGVVNATLRGVYTIVNGFFGTINNALNTINKIPGVNIKTIPRFDPPQLARGGVLTQPTIAMLGEAGDEAVVPLENNTEWIDKLAAKINTATGGNGNDQRPVQLIVQIGEERIMNKVINLINEKTQMSGRNQVIV